MAMTTFSYVSTVLTQVNITKPCLIGGLSTGYQGSPGAHDEVTDDDDDDDDDDEDAVWNVCVEVSLEHQSNVGVF